MHPEIPLYPIRIEGGQSHRQIKHGPNDPVIGGRGFQLHQYGLYEPCHR